MWWNPQSSAICHDARRSSKVHPHCPGFTPTRMAPPDPDHRTSGWWPGRRRPVRDPPYLAALFAPGWPALSPTQSCVDGVGIDKRTKLGDDEFRILLRNKMAGVRGELDTDRSAGHGLNGGYQLRLLGCWIAPADRAHQQNRQHQLVRGDGGILGCIARQFPVELEAPMEHTRDAVRANVLRYRGGFDPIRRGNEIVVEPAEVGHLTPLDHLLGQLCDVMETEPPELCTKLLLVGTGSGERELHHGEGGGCVSEERGVGKRHSGTEVVAHEVDVPESEMVDDKPVDKRSQRLRIIGGG